MIFIFLKEGILTTTVTTVTIATILESVSSIVTSAVAWVGQFMNVITDNPLILMFVLVAFVGLGVGLIKRLIRL